jgi:hypothetical protein
MIVCCGNCDGGVGGVPAVAAAVVVDTELNDFRPELDDDPATVWLLVFVNDAIEDILDNKYDADVDFISFILADVAIGTDEAGSRDSLGESLPPAVPIFDCLPGQ